MAYLIFDNYEEAYYMTKLTICHEQETTHSSNRFYLFDWIYFRSGTGLICQSK